MACNLDNATRNIATSLLVIFFLYTALGPAGSIQNIALGDSTDIEPVVGYYLAVTRIVGGVIAASIFTMVYRTLGIKATIGTGMLLTIPAYIAMIWINRYVLYITFLLLGIGEGILWAACTMATADNSKPGETQKNMGLFLIGFAVSNVVGGLFNYLYMGNRTLITTNNRIMIYSVSAAVGCVGALTGIIGMREANPPELMPLKEAGSTEAEDLAEVSKNRAKLRHYYDWIRANGKRRAFWILLIANIYWSTMWGFYTKILPTAVGAVLRDRKQIFLPGIFIGGSYLAGAVAWPRISQAASATVTMVLVAVLLASATVLSVLVFPEDAAVNMNTTQATYITPHPYIIAIVASCVGFADSGFAVVYYAVVAEIFADDTAMGFSIVNVWFCTFNMMSMFVTPLVSLHAFLYFQFATIVLTCVSVVTGLRRYL